MTEFFEHEGEPTQSEIDQRNNFRERWGVDHLAISHPCPYCNGRNTELIREQWNICYTCFLAFEYRPSKENLFWEQF